jgi:hypothetical protein
MSDFDFKPRGNHDGEASSVDDIPPMLRADAPSVAEPWSPDAPAPLLTKGPLPGLFASAGVGDDRLDHDNNTTPAHRDEMVWRQPPTLIDVDEKMLEADQLLDKAPQPT